MSDLSTEYSILICIASIKDEGLPLAMQSDGAEVEGGVL